VMRSISRNDPNQAAKPSPAAVSEHTTGSIRILHLEDDPVTSELISEWLREDGLRVEIERVDRLSSFAERLATRSHDLVLSDFTIPGMDTFVALRLAHRTRPDLPYVFFSGTLGEEAAVEALKNGATDFVPKDHPGRLPAAVRRALQEAKRGPFGAVEGTSPHEGAEDALRKSEERFRSFVESANHVIWRMNAVGEADQPMPSWNAFTGQTVAQAAGFGWTNAIHPDDRARVIEAWRTASGSKSTYQVEYRLQGQDGQWHHILARGTPILEADGSVREYVGVCNDITRQREAEEELRRSEQRFRAIFEQAAIGIGLVDLKDARWLAVNEPFCRMLGYTPEFMRATPWPQITHPQDVNLDLVPFQQMAAGQRDSYSVEKRFVHRDGHPVWARLTLSLVRDAQGRPDYEIAIIENIDDRKRAEGQLQRQAKLIDLSPTATIVRSPEGVISFWSAGAEALYGWTAQQALGRTTHELLQTGFPQTLDEIVAEIRRSGKWSGELRHRTKDG